MRRYQFYLMLYISATLISCEKEKKSEQGNVNYNKHGVFIINEGSYGSGNGSVTYLPVTGYGMIPDVFKQANGVGLGDVVQSMSFFNDKFYVVVNNSQKIEVVDANNFKSLHTIAGLSSPRYFLAVDSSKAYVSDWVSNQVKIIDLLNLTVTGSVNVGEGPEQMAKSNNKVYVANVGGFGNDSTISIIDITTNSVIKTIVVGLNPNSIINLQNNKLLVLCGGTTGPDYTGGTSDDIAGSIFEIDATNDVVTRSDIFSQYNHPVKLVANSSNNKIYFLSGTDGYTGNVDEFDLANFTAVQLISGNFYGLGVNHADGKIYCGRPGFTANDYVLRYASSGIFTDSLPAGIGPNGFLFN